MENPGERLVGDYLRHIKHCHFVDFNVYTIDCQGEIDVVGVNHDKKVAYICEVATHLTTGLLYVRDGQTDTANRLIAKFIKDIRYGNAAFPEHTVHYMFWSPVIRRSRGRIENNQFSHIHQIKEAVLQETGIQIEVIINEDYLAAIEKLRSFARQETKELKSPIMRMLQIEEWARKNVVRNATHSRSAASRQHDQPAGDPID